MSAIPRPSPERYIPSPENWIPRPPDLVSSDERARIPGSPDRIPSHAAALARPESIISSTPTPTASTAVRNKRRTTPRTNTRGRRRDNTHPTTTSSGDRKRSANGAKKTKGLKSVEGDSDGEKEAVKTEEECKCPVCLEEPTVQEMSSVNGCAHVFCFSCIEKWAERENSCPLCKSRFTKIERVHKIPSKKRKKGERTKNTKRVNHRDQRSDFVSGTPFQSLFASLEGVNRTINRNFTDLIFSTMGVRNGVVSVSATHNNSARATRSGNRSPSRGPPYSIRLSEDGTVGHVARSVERDMEQRQRRRTGRSPMVSTTSSDHEPPYLQEIRRLIANSTAVGHPHLRTMIRIRHPFQPTRGPDADTTGDGDGNGNDSENTGSSNDHQFGNIAHFLDGLPFGEIRESASHSQSGGETAATAIEIEDSDTDELPELN